MNLQKISWDESVWFSDIDDTLIDTAALTYEGSIGIREVFAKRFGEEVAAKIQKNFNDIFNLLMIGHQIHVEEDWSKHADKRQDYDNLWVTIESYQQEIKAEFGAIRKFSREVFIKIACDQEHLTVDPETIYEAADYYWLRLSEKTELLPGVLELLTEIKKHNRPLFLVTGSDARLKIKENGQFVYDPVYSEAFKRQRVQLLREKGLEFNTVSIGDPEDKPHLDFFQKGVKAAEENLGHAIDLSKAIMIGDSYAADMATPKEKMGFGLVVLYKEWTKTEVIDEHYLVTGNLVEITKFLQ